MKVVWEAQGIIDDNLNKATLFSALRDHALTCYIKYTNGKLNVRVGDIQIALNREFNRPKSKSRSIIRFK